MGNTRQNLIPQLKNWSTVDDTVMGGVSASSIDVQPNGTLTFSGNVSLENNGGFASARAIISDGLDLSGYSGLEFVLKGDGNEYGVNLRSPGMSRLSYRAMFKTSQTIETIYIPFTNLVPTSFGSVIDNAPSLDLAQVTMIGLIITGKQRGAFRLTLLELVGFSD